MIPFPFNENQFSFFVADHLLVGQLCTNPKSDRSLLSCLKVTQCSTSKIGDAPRYISCSLPIQVMTTGPLPAPSKCKSRWFNAWRHSSMHQTTLWRWWSRSPRLRTPPGRSRPRSSSKRSRQSLMRLLSGLFSRLPEILAFHTQLWMHVWRRTWSVGPTGTRQARSWLIRQKPQANQVRQVAQQTEASQETKHALVLFRQKELLPGPGAQQPEPSLDCHK